MLINKLAGKNYFVALLILLGITTALVICAFVLNAFFPDSLGTETAEYEFISAYYFEPWSFDTENLIVSYPDGGTIVTIEETGNKRSFLLLGKGDYQHLGDKLPVNDLGGIFIKVEDFYFELLRGSIIFLPVDDVTELAHITEIIEMQNDVTVIWKDTVPISFTGEENPLTYYFLSSTGEPLLPPYVNISALSLFGTYLIYILFAVIMFLIIAIFTLDHKYSRYWQHLMSIKPGIIIISTVLLSVSVIAITIIITDYNKMDPFYSSIGYFLILFILIILNRNGIVDYLDLGLRRDRLKHGYLLAIMTTILVIGTVRGMPKGVCFDDLTLFLYLPVIFLLISLPRELFWRGFVLPVLCRQWGINRGLFFMALLTGLLKLITIAAIEPHMLSYPYTYLEVAVLVPGLSAILGYLYLRTENILASAFMYSLILWLPDVILY